MQCAWAAAGAQAVRRLEPRRNHDRRTHKHYTLHLSQLQLTTYCRSPSPHALSCTFGMIRKIDIRDGHVPASQNWPLFSSILADTLLSSIHLRHPLTHCFNRNTFVDSVDKGSM